MNRKKRRSCSWRQNLNCRSTRHSLKKQEVTSGTSEGNDLYTYLYHLVDLVIIPLPSKNEK